MLLLLLSSTLWVPKLRPFPSNPYWTLSVRNTSKSLVVWLFNSSTPLPPGHMTVSLATPWYPPHWRSCTPSTIWLGRVHPPRTMLPLRCHLSMLTRFIAWLMSLLLFFPRQSWKVMTRTRRTSCLRVSRRWAWHSWCHVTCSCDHVTLLFSGGLDSCLQDDEWKFSPAKGELMTLLPVVVLPREISCLNKRVHGSISSHKYVLPPPEIYAGHTVQGSIGRSLLRPLSEVSWSLGAYTYIHTYIHTYNYVCMGLD